jgi:hypothetical protein
MHQIKWPIGDFIQGLYLGPLTFNLSNQNYSSPPNCRSEEYY